MFLMDTTFGFIFRIKYLLDQNFVSTYALNSFNYIRNVFFSTTTVAKMKYNLRGLAPSEEVQFTVFYLIISTYFGLEEFFGANHTDFVHVYLRQSGQLVETAICGQ